MYGSAPRPEIISIINLLSLSMTFWLPFRIVIGRTLIIRMHYGNNVGTGSTKSLKYMLQLDKGESEVNTHLG